ncbi:cell division protein FtsB [Agrobacterium tumefaciens]|uniref:Cell division protein FtsB n=1 Tax=Agrobacterium tumefaciens TaxID=358 RepID=A0AAW8LQT9_AGRTU|nr:hypothetical protein [Agrobacterium tumefaciens]MBP2564631.1 cell division protein FtsB [Agrobacterium tumefaciens]MDR6701504.1 cell division protein FtsB [Agrobacterium tumefaciens]
MAGKPNAAELEMLTEEEREGMLDEDTVDEGLEDGDDAGDDTGAAGDDKAGEGADQEGKDKADAAEEEDGDEAGADADGEAEAKAKQEADARAAADAAAAEAAAGGGDDNTTASAAAEAKPLEGDKRPSWVLDPKVPEQIEALEKQKDELDTKWDDGELTGPEYRAEIRKIDAQLDVFKEQRMAANIGKTNAVQHYFDVTVPDFLAKHTEYEKGSILHAMLEAEVKKLQVQSQNPLNPAILERAHQNLTEQVTKAYGVKPSAQNKQPGTKPAAAAREVVPTLGTVPAADANDDSDGGEFAYLDRLANSDVEKYEQELAKLSDEKRDRYLAE